MRRFAARLKRFEVTPTGSEGYAKAEVTVGGIDTRDLSSKTMEARNVPGLYAIGEAVDVTGWLGGYNFQWAWSSGWCAGQAIARALSCPQDRRLRAFAPRILCLKFDSIADTVGKSVRRRKARAHAGKGLP